MESHTPQPSPECPGCERLAKRVQELEAIVEELRAAAKRQAAPFNKGTLAENPKKPGRKPGNLYGIHARRMPPEEIDEVLHAAIPTACPDCKGPLEEIGTDSQFQEEIAPHVIRREITIHIGRCRCCGRRVQGRHPYQTSDALGAAAPQIGPKAQVLMASLNKETGASHGKIARFCKRFFGLSVSRGGVAQAIQRLASRCEPAYQEIRFAVRNSDTAYADETGWRVGGRLHWLWAFISELATAYAIRNSRGFDVVAEFLGEDYAGRLGHDGWSVYDKLTKAIHQQCNQHFIRRCSELLQSAKCAAAEFPRQLKALLLRGLALRDRRDEGEISAHGLLVATGLLEARMDSLLKPHRTCADNERFAKHLRKHRGALLTYLREPGLEACNWPGEQAIRPSTANRKVWGGNRTARGAHTQEVLLSVLRTLPQNGREVVDYLVRALTSGRSQQLFRATGILDPPTTR